ncbi:MAG: hypothetical protein P8Q55_04395 [Candidatus Poseidoniaceae archaeon]|nr:hypothetical protein [Candidatus Poseidoniaceae archaeon]
MQSIGHANGPTSEGNVEVLGSLTLDGTSGKVRAVLDENMITFESKTGHLTSIRLSTIQHTHHHNSRLAPFWIAFLGVMFVWFGYRIIDPINFRIGAMIIGGVFISSWIFTGRPTLTIETKDNVCFAIMGNDARLMRMNHLMQRIIQGMSLQEARDGLELLERDTDYPGITSLEDSFETVIPVHIETPQSISTLLGEVDDNPMSMFDSGMFSSDEEEDVLELEYAVEVEAETGLPDWFTNDGPELDMGLFSSDSADGLIQRANENIETRRGHIQSSQQYGVAQPTTYNNQNNPPQIPYHEQFGNSQPQYNQPASPQMHQFSANVQQPANNQFPTHHSMQTPQTMSGPAVGDNGLFSQVNSETSSKQEAGESQLPEPIPNFWNADGAHVPAVNQQTEDPMASISAPDTLGNSITINRENSIIANARSNNIDADSSSEQQESSKQNYSAKYSRLKPQAKGVDNHSRLKRHGKSAIKQGSGLISGIVKSSLAIGAKRATQVAQSASKVAVSASKNLLSSESSYDISESTESLRVRSNQTQSEEALSSIQNLSIKEGGKLPQSEVDRLQQHISRSNSLIEQEEQDALESASFEDLIDSESQTSGKAGLLRLD